MTRGKTHRVAGILLAVFALLPQAGTQAQDSATLQAGFEAVRAKQRLLISGSLPLTEAEGAAFWPRFDKYQAELQRLDARASAVISEFLAGQSSLTAARAEAITDEQLQVEEDYLKALRAHARVLKGILPAQKLAKYVQLQRKLDVSVRYDLAQKIPLLP
jgi:hypothetical protein